MVGMDFDMGDGQMQVVIGFDDGLIEVRKHRSGDLVHSVTMSGFSSINAQSTVSGKDKPIANLFYYDFRMNGNK